MKIHSSSVGIHIVQLILLSLLMTAPELSLGKGLAPVFPDKLEESSQETPYSPEGLSQEIPLGPERLSQLNPDSSEVEVVLEGQDLLLRNDLVVLRYDLSAGRFNIEEGSGTPLVQGAEALAKAGFKDSSEEWRSSNFADVSWSEADVENALGSGKSIAIRGSFGTESLELLHTFTLLDGLSCVLSELEMRNAARETVSVGSLSPLHTEAPDGTALMGNPSDIRVLTNGYLDCADYITPILPGTMSTLSNWSSLLFNQSSELSVTSMARGRNMHPSLIS